LITAVVAVVFQE
jgi:hypothetical protein